MKESLGHRFRFRTWLFLLALAAALPVMVFAVVSVLEIAQGQQRGVNDRLLQRAQAAANAVDRSLAFKVAMLEAVTHSQSALDRDLFGLYAHAKNLEPALPDVLALTLIDGQGAQIFNTLRPFGPPLPPTGNVKAAQQVIRTGRPAVSGLFTGSVSGQFVTALGVPLRVRRTPVYCLRMVTMAKEYTGLLADQHLPQGWTATLIDAEGTIVGRTRSATAFVGTRIDAALLEYIQAGQSGTLDSVNQEGVPVRLALAPVGEWGWTVGVHVPMATLQEPVRRHLLWLAGGMALCVLGGMTGAWWLSRRLAGEMDQVTTASAALASGAEPGPAQPPGMVREFRDVERALSEARQRGEQAQLDHLTRLPGRARFLSQAARIEELCRARPGLRLAVLFLDLDGFKQVNDQYGHERGDEILVQTAGILSAEVRQGDAVGRVGGDEFVICLAAEGSTARHTAEGVAGRVIARVGGIGHGIGCSVGVVLCPEGQPDLERALAASDEAMYQAKRCGKNCSAVRELPRAEPAAGA